MASHQPVPPSNPFDGFDNYSTVAQQPPQQQHQQQQQPLPPNQSAQQPLQPAVQHQTAPVATIANPFGFSPSPAAAPAGNNTANPFSLLPGGNPEKNNAQQPPAPLLHQNQTHPTQQHLPPQQQQQQQQQQQHIVPLAPNAVVQSPWALNSGQLSPPVHQPGAGALVTNPAVGGQTYDPFGVFGASPAPPKPNQQPPNFQAQQQQPQFQAQSNLFVHQPHQLAQPPSAQQNLQNETKIEMNQSILPDENEDEALALIDVELDDESDDHNSEKSDNHRKDGQFFEGKATTTRRKNSKSRGSTSSGKQRNTWDRNPDVAPPPPLTPGRRHAEYLAVNSARPAITSPIPKYELVHHSGYVLSRISFRTVLMRKWKQTFWIQYGPTQLLFFRTFSDYEDWLNNPYHTQKAREFLVKLRVDFVSDLKKSSVMGYQVTQVRRKPYGKNVMLHFKLERWMDYGPTIAAAFAAREDELMNSPSHQNDGEEMNTSNDVAALRKIILGCMRNARDAASSASGGEERYRGRYDGDHERERRMSSDSRNMGYHQAFSAESGQRRCSEAGGTRGLEERDAERLPTHGSNPSLSTESSQEELETEQSAAPPVVDLLG